MSQEQQLQPTAKVQKRNKKRAKRAATAAAASVGDDSFSDVDTSGITVHNTEGASEEEHFKDFNLLRVACKDIVLDKAPDRNEGSFMSFNYVCKATRIKQQPSNTKFDEDKLRQCLITLMEAQEQFKHVNSGQTPAVSTAAVSQPPTTYAQNAGSVISFIRKWSRSRSQGPEDEQG
jgi:hypothetical protein